MRAEIISVGTEILLGHIINTNAAYLSRKLAELGIDQYYRQTVGDNPARLQEALLKALSRSDIVFTIGGLGPTVDDITACSIGSTTSRALIFDKKIEKYIKEYFKRREIRRIPKDAVRQANIPRGARWFKNRVGTAPAILINHGKKIIVALPGPPRELIPIVEKNIIPYFVRKGLAGKSTIKTKTIKVAGLAPLDTDRKQACLTGLAEVDVNRIVKDLLSIGPLTTLGIYAHLGEVSLKITSKAKSKSGALREIKKVEAKLRKRLGNFIYGVDDETLEFVVGKTLLKKKKTLAIAESCTGGLIANRITDVSKSSKYFKMGIVAYSNKAKIDLLGVGKDALQKYGAVSKEVALLMAEGIRNKAGADFAVGVTGIAGPTGRTKKKPVGLVYIALISNKMKIVKKCLFVGNRTEIKLQASIMALNLMRALR